MQPPVKKIFSVSKTFYFIHFAIGLVFLAIYLLLHWFGVGLFPLTKPAAIMLNVIAYPFAYSVAFRCADVAVTINIFWINEIALVIIHVIAAIIAWHFALFIAPIVLLYIYFQDQTVE